MTHGTARVWRFGCQARPWIQTLGMPTFREALPTVMRHIDGIGFTGFETALPALPLDAPSTFMAWRASANDIALAAAHTGGTWWEPDVAATVPSIVERASRLPELGCDRLLVSIGAGVTHLDGKGLAQVCRTLRTLGEGCSQHGVTICIHNHAHELQDDARVLRAILEYTDPEQVSLGADIGWVVNGGWDVVDFLAAFGDRIGYLHVRDVIARLDPPGFIEVGHGTMDWSAVTARVRDLGFDGWLTAESEYSELWHGREDAIETATAQYEGMTRVFGTHPG